MFALISFWSAKSAVEGLPRSQRKRLPNISRSAAYRAIQMHENIGMYPELGILSEAAKVEASAASLDVKAIIAERVEAGEVFTAAHGALSDSY